ncbi:tyrosinase [Bacillus wiedmannii bv. thuringiensis]|nr:tyrosinase [Bacillus wiedmannii bv. thuringiensis]
MRIRKSVRSLSSEEKKAFVEALLSLKKNGRYDEYVHWHHAVMEPTVLPNEPRDARYRNGAHRGPAFLPWHREFLMQVEADLQKIDSAITIPYWNWTEDAELPDPTKAPIWSDDFMGGNGVESEGWRVESGPFAFKNGNWPIPEGHGGPALMRQFGGGIQNFNLPTKEDLAMALGEVFYDTPPYNVSPFTLGFRNRIEGWVTKRGDNQVKTDGTQLHNRVHVWVGGSMVPMTSPNDPVFLLHHCFVDKVWADWQERRAKDEMSPKPNYAPEKDGPPGHNLDDIMKPWNCKKIRDVLDISELGYSYEQPVIEPAFVAESRPFSPFETI